MKHEILLILEQIEKWEGLVVVRAKDGGEWEDYLFRPWLTRQSDWSVYSVYFNVEDVEEIRIRADERPLIILKQDTPTKVVGYDPSPARKDWLERLGIDYPVGCDGVQE